MLLIELSGFGLPLTYIALLTDAMTGHLTFKSSLPLQKSYDQGKTKCIKSYHI